MNPAPFTARDDNFHFADMSDRWWETETCWFSFAIPERRMGGWVYIMARPNIGTAAGGCWIWDDSAELPWEIRHCTNLTAMRLPRDQELTDIKVPSGVSVRMLAPLTSYQVGFVQGNDVRLDMRFDAVMPPQPLTNANSAFAHLNHFDQIGHVTGTLLLDGEHIAIDCYAMRDRSWGPRPEYRSLPGSYVAGMAGPREGFLVLSNPALPGDPVTHGFLLRDGEVSPIVEGHRRVERDRQDGRTLRLTIDARDERGRILSAEGEAVSRTIINRHSFIDSMSLVRWSINGTEGWGEDQDLWPYARWARYMRKLRG